MRGAAVLLAFMALAGCGADARDTSEPRPVSAGEYERHFEAVTKRLEEAEAEIVAGAEPRTKGDLARVYERLARTFGDARSRLAEVEPPVDLRIPANTYERRIAAVTDLYRHVADSLMGRTADRISHGTARTRAAQLLDGVTAARDELRRQLAES